MKRSGLIIICLFILSPAFGQNWDIDLLKEINLNRNSNLDRIFIEVTDSAAIIAYSLPVLFVIVGFLKRNSSIKSAGIYMGITVLVSALISNILKYGVHRVRPFEIYPFLQNVGEGRSPSFPSGHTADAFALATAISISYPKWYLVIPFYVWAFVVGYSRMDLGVHYPSDVLGGMLIGAGSSFICYKIIERNNKKL